MSTYILTAVLLCQPAPASELAKNSKAGAAKRADQVRQWQAIVGPVPIDDEFFEALEFISPQREGSFLNLTDEKLSVNLVRDAISWTREFFRDPFNPCASMVAEGSLAPSPFDYDWRDPRYDFQAPYLSRHRPTRYYLSPQKEFSLLMYEYEAGDYKFQMMESSAGMLVRIRPKGQEFKIEEGIPGREIVALLERVLNLEHARKQKFSKIEPFNLPETIDRAMAFHNLHKDPAERFGDWSQQVHGCISAEGLFVVLRKTDIVSGAKIPVRAHCNPNPLWLRRDLYLNDGKTLVIDRQPDKNP